MCDELGILIWQDMMFACSMYPTSDEFLASVAAEVTHNVLRLQHHACIAVWAGNNENEAALSGNWSVHHHWRPKGGAKTPRYYYGIWAPENYHVSHTLKDLSGRY